MITDKTYNQNDQYFFTEFKNISKELLPWLENLAWEYRCKIEKKVYKHYSRSYSGPGRQLYYYYFIFTDKSGRIRKFQFQQPIYGHEVETLKKRIDQAAGISRKRRKTRKSSV